VHLSEKKNYGMTAVKSKFIGVQRMPALRSIELVLCRSEDLCRIKIELP
jgi:hypothetical protein